MDDIGKAVVMVGQVLMFAFAASVAIYLYSSLMSHTDQIMLSSNFSNRGDAIVGVDDNSYTRTATKAEVVMAVMGLKDKVEKTGDTDYKVKVGGNTIIYSGDVLQYSDGSVEFPMNSTGRSNLLNSVITKDEYDISYNDEKTLIYN